MALTQRVITDGMPFIMILLIRCSLTVCLMCPAMSFVATLLFKDYQEAGLVGVWLQTAALNFPMALCWQIFFAGPAGRGIFRCLCSFWRKRRSAR